MDDSAAHENHLTALEVARYLDETGPGNERERVETHLAECADCRHDVTSAKELVERPRRWSRRITGAVATLAAASIVIAIGAHLRVDRDASNRARVRAGAGDASPLPVHAPSRSARAGALRFVWGSAPGALSYQFALSRSDGTPMWARGGPDTALTLPDSVVVTSGTSYLWTADALLPDGSTRSTGVREVSVMP